MSHQLDFMPWINRVRHVAAAIFITAAVVLVVAEMAYSNLSTATMFVAAAQALGNILPWLEVSCGSVIVGTVCALISTWVSRDWWVDRWVRSHENFVG